MPQKSNQAPSERSQNTAPQQGAPERPRDLDHGQEVPQASTIAEHMEVYASCGTRVGKVDNVDGKSIKLTKSDSQAGGKHHFIPMSWVDHVDQHVHLTKNSEDVMRDWQAETIGTTG